MYALLYVAMWGFIFGTLAWVIVGAIRDARRGPIAATKFVTLKRGERVSTRFLDVQTIPIGFFPFDTYEEHQIMICSGQGVCPFCGPYDWEREQEESQRTPSQPNDRAQALIDASTAWDSAFVESLEMVPGASQRITLEG